jgi:hypothetical protein
LQELATVDGTSIWVGDGVHLTSNATRVAATKLMAYIAGGGETQEPTTKRARLESVIPVRATPPPAGKAAKSAPPPTPKPVPPPPPVAVRPAAGKPARTQSPARPTAWRVWQPQYKRRPARTSADCPGQGREQGAGPEAVDQAAGAAGESSPRKRTT